MLLGPLKPPLDAGGRSMSAQAFDGMNRLQVVQTHLAGLLRSMEGVKHAAFGIVQFNGSVVYTVAGRDNPFAVK